MSRRGPTTGAAQAHRVPPAMAVAASIPVAPGGASGERASRGLPAVGRARARRSPALAADRSTSGGQPELHASAAGAGLGEAPIQLSADMPNVGVAPARTPRLRGAAMRVSAPGSRTLRRAALPSSEPATGHSADGPLCYAPDGSGEGLGRGADVQADPKLAAPLAPAHAWRVADARLLLLASVLDDLESARIAASNRLRAFTATLGVDPEQPEVVAMRLLVEETQAVEARVAAGLAKAMKAHPLGALVERTKGLGLRQAARLLSLIGNPAWHAVHQRPRRLGELRAYCGMHVVQAGGAGDGHSGSDALSDCAVPGVAPRRRRGQRSNWSESARKRVWLIAAQGLKLRCKACTAASRAAADADGAGWTPPPPTCTCEREGYVLRRAYDDARAKYAAAVHAAPCERCGPAGSPAPAGSPLSASHQHGRALRIVGKAVLRMLWEESMALCGFELAEAPPEVSPKPARRKSGRPTDPEADLDLRARMCEGKVPWPTRSAAVRERDRLAATLPGRKFKTYRCLYGEHFHVGGQH